MPCLRFALLGMAMSNVFSFHPKIPLARDVSNGHPLRAREALYPAKEGLYECLDPKCGGSLNVVRRGRTVYFRHNPGKATENCGFSHYHCKSFRRHDAAQFLLATVLREAIEFRMALPVLRVEHAGKSVFTTLCMNATTVCTEWTSPSINRRADIALLDKYGDPVLLIEIFHTHAVDHNKRLDLSKSRWFEVGANDVISDYEHLVVRHHGNVLPYIFDPNYQQLSLNGMQRMEW